MEVSNKKIEDLIKKIGSLQVEIKSIYNEIYMLSPNSQKLEKKQKRQELDDIMRKNLLKAAKIKP